MTVSATADIVDQSNTIADAITAENTTTVSPGTAAPNEVPNSTNTESVETQEDKMDYSNIAVPTITTPTAGDLDSDPIVTNPEPPTNEELPAEVSTAKPVTEEGKPILNVDSSVPKAEFIGTSPRSKGMAEPKTPRRLEGLSSFESPSDADSERRSGWRPVKRNATHTFASGQPSDHASFPTRPTHVGNVPNSARLGTDTEKTLYTLSATLDRRERELDRHDRELDRRERELERMERELERRRRDFEQDRTRWETQTQTESYLQAVTQPQINKPAPSQETFPAQWQTALESFKKSLQAQITLERREAESVLEARILRRVNDELAKERKMQEVMQMSDKEVNELMEDTVGHWLRKDEDIADNIRFQSLLHLAQEKMAAVAGIQLLPDTDSWALSWRLAIGPSFITRERYSKAMDLLKDKEVDDAAKAVIESQPAMEFIVEWTTHLRKDESFIPGRISREEYLESVRRQVDKLNLDEQAFVALVNFVAPN